MKTISVERQFALGVAGLLAGGIARGAMTRRRGARNRRAAYDVIERAGGGLVEVDAHRPPGARLGVIFSNGLGAPHEEWAWVCAHLPEDVAYLKYHRPGYGLSSRAGHAAAPDGRAAEQFSLIDELRDRFLGDLPVVVAGHSLGGYLAAAYAARRPGEGISHVVLVDATTIEDLVRCRGALSDRWTRQHLVMEWLCAGLGLNIARPMSRMREGYPEEIRDAFTAFQARPGSWATALREYREAFSYPAVGRLGIPLHVVTAVNGLSDVKSHAASQRSLLQLSDRATQHLVDGTDHVQVVSEEVNAKTIAELIVTGGDAR
jgi:pimeloyl-ACP methyl ester carboxylesterase